MQDQEVIELLREIRDELRINNSQIKWLIDKAKEVENEEKKYLSQIEGQNNKSSKGDVFWVSVAVVVMVLMFVCRDFFK
ncbi:hypothetical protein ONV78_28160 [Hahella sp. CR1]|uniref:hypothetical protein n=1 Tax=Hahella sp. CR1 TaxID=2992807 RepID=UPI0024430638|nr:hypothetical protein [Hahella sp. CR1]MDG9671643.1 hypothetical protein [Hahella sp. CR1]